MGVHFKENEEKITIGMIISGIIIIGILIASLIVYLLNVTNSNTEGEILTQESQMGKEVNDDEFESVSIDMGKTVNEASNETDSNTEANTKDTTVLTNTTNSSNSVNAGTTTKTNTSSSKSEKSNTMETNSNNATSESNTENEEVVKFTEPIKGEIIREFAPDFLVYSETLEEWVTHNGIDIKADKTSVVKSVADGTVYAIKNDPRYGLTVIVNHECGYQSVYANLLTAEYVVEGEEIEAGQTIGTVGNTATFEISDDYHLHFELLKDGEYVNPSICISESGK